MPLARSRKHRLITGSVCALGLLAASAAAQGEPQDPAAGGSGSEAEGSGFSHADWAATLERFVDERGMVDYQDLARDREVFDRYVRDIEARSPRSHPELFADRDEGLAYWINAYNALIFDGVLDRGPETKSVWTGGLISGRAFFVGRQITVGGETTNLKSLEDDWIRAGYEDPRIHAALNCASISCPRLPREPFTGDRLEAQLDAAMREFVADPRNALLRDDGSVGLSKIFDWFARDFLDEERRRGTESPSIIGYVNRYRSEDAQLPVGAKVDHFPYDKGINAQ